MGTPCLAEQEPLQQPATAVIQGHALRLVQETDVAVARLVDPRDTEALHDARVGLRRLRGWLQAFAAELPLKRKQRRHMRDLAHATNTARDAEVGLEWLGVLAPSFDPRAKAGVAVFSKSLAAVRDENYAELRRSLPKDWHRLSHKLGVALKKKTKDARLFREPFGASLQCYVEGFSATLDAARHSSDPASIHRLRIAGKKLRYLLETILPWHPEHEELIHELKALHELAGSIHDLQRLLALSEHAFQRQAARQYRKLLETYAEPATRTGRLRKPDLSASAVPLLWICRGTGLVQAERVKEFRKLYLGRRRPTFLKRLRTLCSGSAALDSRRR